MPAGALLCFQEGLACVGPATAPVPARRFMPYPVKCRSRQRTGKYCGLWLGLKISLSHHYHVFVTQFCWAGEQWACFAPDGSCIIFGITMNGSKNNWHDAGRNFRSYLLRCWQEGPLPDVEEPGELLAWRFTLVPLNDESSTKGFACLEALCASLREELEAEASN